MPPVKNKKTQPKKAIIPKEIPQQTNNNFAIFTIVAIVVIVIAVFAVYFFDKSRTNNLFNDETDFNSDQQQVPLNENDDTAQDPYEKWNSYKNASNTFAIKYPSNWELKTENGIIKLIYPDSTTTEFAIDYKTTSKSLSQYLSDLDKTASTAYEGKPLFEIKDQKEITVNGFSATQRLQQVKSADLQQKITYVYSEGKILSFSMTSGQLSEEWLQAYDLILGSFNFTSSSSAQTSTSTLASNVSSSVVTTTSSTTATTNKSIDYKNTAFGFILKYDSSLKPKSDASGINFNINGSQYLKISGSESEIPSLINYHPNGANVAGQTTIGEKEAMKFLVVKNDLTYVQYVIALNSKKWLKIEYQGNKENALGFEKIISTIKFN